MEGEIVGLAHVQGLLEQAMPGVDRAAMNSCCASKRQDIGVGRRILAPLRELERLFDVSLHLLAGRQPRQHTGEGSLSQRERKRTAFISGVSRGDGLAR